MRGLPFECEVEHILAFLGDHSKNIVEQGVHMVVNAQVRNLALSYNFNNFLIYVLL